MLSPVPRAASAMAPRQGGKPKTLNTEKLGSPCLDAEPCAARGVGHGAQAGHVPAREDVLADEIRGRAVLLVALV